MIDTHTNPPVGEPLLQPKQTIFKKTKTFKNTKAGLNDYKKWSPHKLQGFNKKLTKLMQKNNP